MPLWNISKMFQNSSHIIRGTGVIETNVFPENEHLIFVAREKLQIYSDTLREMSVKANLRYNATQEFVTFGKSTAVKKSSIIIQEDRKESEKRLCEQYVKTIYINASTRRPMELPKWYKDTYERHAHNPVANKTPIFQPPKTSFTTNIEIGFSDTDYNGHLNAAEYYRILMDCASTTSTSGYYQHFSLDMCWYPLREIDAAYLGESGANDLLDIHTWQENDNIVKIYFMFYLKGKHVFQASCIFDTIPYARNVEAML